MSEPDVTVTVPLALEDEIVPRLLTPTKPPISLPLATVTSTMAVEFMTAPKFSPTTPPTAKLDPVSCTAPVTVTLEMSPEIEPGDAADTVLTRRRAADAQIAQRQITHGPVRDRFRRTGRTFEPLSLMVRLLILCPSPSKMPR